ncbi:MAG: hypothetical protein Q9157_007954 [Trypethelium eluteriae]
MKPDDLQRSAENGCNSCDLLVRAVSVFEELSDLPSRSSYGSPYKISGEAKQGTALCVSWDDPHEPGKVFKIELLTSKDAKDAPKDFAIGTGGRILPMLGCQVAVKFIKKSLEACVSGHKECTRVRPSSIPKRLLHVGRKHSTGFGDPYLVQDLKSLPPYVALSYCWGKKTFRRMTRASLDQDKRGIALRTLPRSFQDAISLLRDLDIDYLWVDALCIIQGDKNDWELEGAKMNRVYTHALFVISVTFGHDANSGFLSYHPPLADPENQAVRSRDAKRASIIENHLQYILDGKSMSIRVRKKLQHDAIVGQLLSTMNPDPEMPVLLRAWCLQERLLAARTIHFMPEEMIWECSEATCCECDGIELDAFRQQVPTLGSSSLETTANPLSAYKTLFRRQSVAREHLTNLWQHTVVAYSWRDLTYESDRLPALSGMVSLFQNAKMGSYLGGLWLENLPLYLHWRTERINRVIKRVSEPSWSWASIDGPISWETDSSMLKAAVTILTADVVPKDSTGQIVSGIIELIGRTIRAKLFMDWFDSVRPDESFAAITLEGYPYEVPFILDVGQYPPNSPERKRPDVSESQLSVGEEVTCLMVLIRKPQDFPYTLILRQSQRVSNAYERVGLCDSLVLKKFFENAKEERLRLV